MKIERSTGMFVHGFVVGGGYEGDTPELDGLVQSAAEKLAEAFGMDVTIRFNSDRRSGGAFLVVDESCAKPFSRKSVKLGAWMPPEGDDRGQITTLIDEACCKDGNILRDKVDLVVDGKKICHRSAHHYHNTLEEGLAFLQKYVKLPEDPPPAE